MNSALIVSNSKKIIESLSEILAQASVTNIATVSMAGEARRMLIEKILVVYCYLLQMSLVKALL